MSDFDIAIIGGGSAGTAAALTLLRYSQLRPVVIERSDYSGWRVGETLSPGVFPLLQYLGAENTLAEGQRRSYATAAAWGSADVVSRDFLFTGGGDAWHLDRARFDAALAELVRQRGGTLLTESVVTTVEPRWSLGVNGSPITADFVIDATGRHASFARTQGAHVTLDDHLTGLVALFLGGDGGQSATLVEAVEEGWWYSAGLPANVTAVAFMTDADVIRAGRLHEREAWLEHLGATHPTRARIAGAQLVHGPVVCPAHSQILSPTGGDGWVAAGEAAAAFDPLSSMGIGYAIASGIQAARVAASTLGGNTEHVALFTQDVQRHYQAYLAKRQAYYRMEQRWVDAPFWKRRQ